LQQWRRIEEDKIDIIKLLCDEHLTDTELNFDVDTKLEVKVIENF
jgi:hypothetical protein